MCYVFKIFCLMLYWVGLSQLQNVKFDISRQENIAINYFIADYFMQRMSLRNIKMTVVY